MPRICEKLQRVAPEVRLAAEQVPLREVEEKLRLGQIDLAIGNLPSLMPVTNHALLFRDEFACMTRKRAGLPAGPFEPHARRIRRPARCGRDHAARGHPQDDALAAADIAYEHIAELGGLRGKSRGVPDDVNGFWTNRSFHRYADYALSPAFHAGLDRLIAQGHEQRCAIMCSEAVWWRCHRRIVSDYLIARGETVLHIMGRNRVEPARLTAGAVIRDDGTIVYPDAERNDSASHP